MNTQALKSDKATKGQGRVTTPSGIDPLLTIQQLAEHVGVGVGQVYKWRMNGDGPRAVKLGHKIVRYRLSDIEAWLRERESNTTIDA